MWLWRQDLFLASSRPRAALRMQCDVMRWDQALRLAETLDPHVSFVLFSLHIRCKFLL